MKSKRCLAILLAIVITVSGSMGTGGQEARAKGKTLWLKKSSASLKITGSKEKSKYGTAQISVKKAKKVKIKKISFKSKNKKVATVNSKGKVTAKKAGSTKIKVLVKYKYKYKKKKKAKKTLKKTFYYKVTVKDQRKTTTSTKTTATPKPATKAPVVTASPKPTNKPTASPVPTAEPLTKPIEELTFYKEKYVTYVGGYTGVKPVILPVDADVTALEFSSEDDTIASVGENGIIKGVGAGTTQINIRTTDGSNLSRQVEIMVMENQEAVKPVDDLYESARTELIGQIAEKLGTAPEEVNLESMVNSSYKIKKVYSNFIDEKVEPEAEKDTESYSLEDKTSEDAVTALYSTSKDTDNMEDEIREDLSAVMKEIDEAASITELMNMNVKYMTEGYQGLLPTVDVGNVTLTEADKYKMRYIVDDEKMNFYISDEDFKNVKSEKASQLRLYVAECLKLAGETDRTERNQNIDLIMKMMEELTVEEDELLEALDPSMSEEDIKTQLATLNPVCCNLKAICSALSDIKYGDYFESILGDELSGNEIVKLQCLAQLYFLDDLCDDEKNLQALKELLKFRISDQFATYTEEGYDLYNNLMGTCLNITGGQLVEGEDAYGMKMHNLPVEKIPWDFNKFYCEEEVTGEEREEVENLSKDIIEEYRLVIQECKWMDDSTKQAAIDKIDKMNVYVFGPEEEDYKEQNYVTLADLDTKAEGGRLVSNIKKIAAADAKKSVTLSGKDWPKEKWVTDSLTINATYGCVQNSFFVHTGILEAGEVYTFGEGKSSKNLGRLGIVIGHEIGHAFDSNGSNYDGEGQASDWFTTKDKETWLTKQKALVDYYNTFFIDTYEGREENKGYFLNGEFSLVENMADLSAVEVITHLVVRESLEDDTKEKLQEVYKNWAYMWSQSHPIEAEVLEKNIHGQGTSRVNGPISMMDEFYESFGVKEGDGMWLAPEQRVRIWSYNCRKECNNRALRQVQNLTEGLIHDITPMSGIRRKLHQMKCVSLPRR
ncbi:MAG: Ig-like domain-containing protein [Eubacterium sp.]|nr:Ig-like domain-containing protein [Eubacterium sp.]